MYEKCLSYIGTEGIHHMMTISWAPEGVSDESWDVELVHAIKNRQSGCMNCDDGGTFTDRDLISAEGAI